MYIRKFKGGFLWIFSFYVRCSTLLHLPPLGFHCVGGCWDRIRTFATTALAGRRSNHSARFHPHKLDLIHWKFVTGKGWKSEVGTGTICLWNKNKRENHAILLSLKSAPRPTRQPPITLLANICKASTCYTQRRNTKIEGCDAAIVAVLWSIQ